MSVRRHASSLVTAAMLILLMGSAVAFELARDRAYGEPAPERGVMYVRSGEAVKRMALSYSAVLADVYWIRALQYYGGTRLSTDANRDFSLLYPLLDIATTLDPQFNIAYRFGSIFLSEPFPGGAGRPDLAVKLLQKGFAHRPDRWQYLQDIGFVYYWWESDYPAAASWFLKSSEVPGAPWWMRSLAAVTATEGGDRRTSRLLWQQLRQTPDNEWLQKEAVRRLQQLDALDAIDALGELVQRYMARTGTAPDSWLALVRAGLLRGVPADPSGTPYSLAPGSGRVTLSPDSKLNPLPVGRGVAVRPAR